MNLPGKLVPSGLDFPCEDLGAGFTGEPVAIGGGPELQPAEGLPRLSSNIPPDRGTSKNLPETGRKTARLMEDNPVRTVDFVATAGAWGWFGLTLVVFDPVLRVARMLGAEPMDRAVGLMCRVLGGSIRAGLGRLELELENIPPQGSYIVVCNHQSLVESFLPFWLLRHLRPRYIAKRALGRWIPAISFNLRRGGHCLIDRTDREGALAAIAELGRRVDSGEVSAFIFPEGTRVGRSDESSSPPGWPRFCGRPLGRTSCPWWSTAGTTSSRAGFLGFRPAPRSGWRSCRCWSGGTQTSRRPSSRSARS